jgi:hypothetical protein
MQQQKSVLWISLGTGIILFGLIVASCTSNRQPALVAVVTPASNRQEADVSLAEGQPTQIAQNRIVLKNATVSITVNDAAATVSAISKIASDEGGWIVNSNTYQQASGSGAKLTYGTITIRVPAAKLDSILDQIKVSAVSVDNVNITGTDVTDQYTDLSSQLTNLKSAEDQLRKIMDSATKTEDVLAVFRQLTDIRGQIEVIQGKLKYYDQAAAYSSIAVTLTPSIDSKPLDVGGWQPGNTIRTAFESLVHIVQALADILIWLVIVILPFAIVAYVIYRISRRFWPQAKPSSTEEQT